MHAHLNNAGATWSIPSPVVKGTVYEPILMTDGRKLLVAWIGSRANLEPRGAHMAISSDLSGQWSAHEPVIGGTNATSIVGASLAAGRWLLIPSGAKTTETVVVESGKQELLPHDNILDRAVKVAPVTVSTNQVAALWIRPDSGAATVIPRLSVYRLRLACPGHEGARTDSSRRAR